MIYYLTNAFLFIYLFIFLKEREVTDSPAQSQVAGPGGPATVPCRRPAPLEGRREGAGTAAATPG